MSATEEERLARVALNRLAEPGDPRMAGLVTELGAERVRDLLLAERSLDGVRTDVAARLASLDPAAELERADRVGLRFVVPGDREWPVGLDDLARAGTVGERGGVPLGLWVRGRVRLDELSDAVAVVGSRSSTGYGDTVARDLSAVAARAGWCVVSGAAFGIDQAAHRGALAVDGPTLAVLACGADRAYPAAHRGLLGHVADAGAVVSESAPGCSPMRVRFLARNRLIAAMARGTVVVEAAVRSGALSTATWTERLQRPLMGVPGPVTAAESQGVHERIRSGAAVLVTGGHDVLELLGRPGEHLVEVPRAEPRPRDRLTTRQQQVLDAVPVARPAGADSVARTAGIGVREVYRALSLLEQQGLVRRSPGGWTLDRAARA
ncbi:DNA-processing protein DprA [Nocardioides solisilvae]|uniref:DNA-processing protein DprA n=1 Tax=Nocardioides solisilvae TaxID=1542435 RepID=UPI000D7465DD|nr:DNA-processing protein DprA [Nocardioides solisilvae]